MSNNKSTNELLVELLAQVNRIHERLDNMDSLAPNKPATLSDDITWEAMFEHMIYTAGKSTIMSKGLVEVYEGAINKSSNLFITPKAYGMLIAKVRRVSTWNLDVLEHREMLTVPGDNCVYVIRYVTDQSTRPAIKTVTHVATITADRRGIGQIEHSEDIADLVKRAYLNF